MAEAKAAKEAAEAPGDRGEPRDAAEIDAPQRRPDAPCGARRRFATDEAKPAVR